MQGAILKCLRCDTWLTVGHTCCIPGWRQIVHLQLFQTICFVVVRYPKGSLVPGNGSRFVSLKSEAAFSVSHYAQLKVWTLRFGDIKQLVQSHTTHGQMGCGHLAGEKSPSTEHHIIRAFYVPLLHLKLSSCQDDSKTISYIRKNRVPQLLYRIPSGPSLSQLYHFCGPFPLN